MKKMRILSLAVAAVLCAGFVSCGDDDDDEPKNSNRDNYTPANPATDEYGIAVSQEVDLGLSVNWASWNVGATAPEEYGGYYAWGETEEKSNYYWSTYKWCNGSYDTLTKYCTDSYYGTVDYKTELEPQDDVAHVKWGNGWRMPTEGELGELKNNCTWEWISYNGVNGYKVTGKPLSNGKRNSIFLPAAGYRTGTLLLDAGSRGGYRSGALSEDYNDALSLCFYSEYRYLNDNNRCCGFTVRPVK